MKFWESTLVMYVIGGNLSMNAMKNYMIKFWNFIQLPELYYKDEGFLIMILKYHKDKDKVFLQGPYTILNMSMFITEWKPDFSMNKDMMCIVPI